jgi:hypothetical protein
MTPRTGSMQAFHRVLSEDLRQPVYLTTEEVRGGWCDLFPELAASVPAPYPIFGTDEERIITYGYPILISDGMWRLRRELEKHVSLETDYRLSNALDGSGEKDQVMTQRHRYLRAVTAVFENVLMNDYGRGLLEVFLLFHSGDVVRTLGQVAKMAQLREASPRRELIEEIRQSIAGVFADLIQRAALGAADSLRKLADGPTTMRMSPLLSIICHDQLLLTDSNPPSDLDHLSGHLQHRLHQDAGALLTACHQSLRRLRELVERHPEIGSLLSTAGAGRLRLDQAKTLLEPRLLDALTAANLLTPLELSPSHVQLLRELGMRLKSFELLASLRRRIRPMERRGTLLVLAGASSATPIAPSTRPFDFASPGVVESVVRRCGLVEVTGRRRPVFSAPRHPRVGRGQRNPASVRHPQAQRFPIRSGNPNGTQLWRLPAAADAQPLRRLAALRVLRTRHRRAGAPDDRQEYARGRGDRRVSGPRRLQPWRGGFLPETLDGGPQGQRTWRRATLRRHHRQPR